MKILSKERKKIYQGTASVLNQYKKGFWLLSLLQALFLINGICIPYLYGLLVDEVMIKKKLSLLVYICLGYVALYLFNTMLIILQKKLQNTTYQKMKLKLRRNLWRQYMRAPFTFHESHGNGDLKQRMDTDIESFENYMNEQIIGYYFNVISTVVYFIIIFFISWKLAIFSFLMVPVSFWMTKQMSKGSGKAWGAYRNDYGDYEGWLQGNLSNWKEIKALNAEGDQERVFGSFWNKLRVNFYKGCLYWFLNRSFISFSNFFITKMNLYFVGGLLIFNGDLKIGMLFVFMKYYEQFFEGIGNINDANIKLQEYKPSLTRVIDVLGMGFSEAGKNRADLKGNIEYENISFKYTEEQEMVLSNVNLKIADGECVAIAGKSGNGKTTLIKLLLGLYQPNTGKIKINDYELSEIADMSLHQQVGVVMQDSVLFNMTIKENLRLTKPDATDDEIKLVCEKAYISKEIEALPKQYNTVIGERGVQLSGGQKQRLAIARVLLNNPNIIIFDEATSALDSESEKMIHKVIAEMKNNKTVIIIAHRMSSILLSDRVLIVDEGNIVADNHYRNLMGNSQEFDSLFKGQYDVVME